MKIIILIVLLLATGPVYTKENTNNAAANTEKSETAQQKSGNTQPGAATPEQNKTHNQQSDVPKTIDLETAYKREYAFLAAQKRELRERLKQFQSSANQEERKLSARVNALERNSVDRSAQIDLLNSQLIEAERNEAALDERNDALENTYSQAAVTLENHDIKIPPAFKDTQGNDPAKVGYLFKQALTLISQLGSINTKPGEFFLEDGKQTEGNIVQLGNIAAYGVSAEGSGSLVPAGGGNFKIWHEPTADIATALSKNEQPELLKLFLFESRTNAIDESPEKTLIEVIESGGVIGWIIVVMGALAALLILLRTYLLYSNSLNTKQISGDVKQQISEGNLDEAKNSCETGTTAIARVLSTTLRHLKDDRDHMDSVVHEAILQETAPLDRFSSAILVIASVSPLLGLLGTVTGMISTFDVITEFGTGDPKLLSGGISIALVTTKLGLTVAIPALLLGSLLTAWARNIKRDMEHAALSITNTYFGQSSEEIMTNDSVNSTLALNN